MLVRIVLRIAANALLLYALAYFVPGITYNGSLITLLFAGLILGIINLFIRPIVVVLSCPLIILTLGLFYFIINGFMLWLVSLLIPEFHIAGIWAFLFGSILFTFLNFLAGLFLPKKKEAD